MAKRHFLLSRPCSAVYKVQISFDRQVQSTECLLRFTQGACATPLDAAASITWQLPSAGSWQLPSAGLQRMGRMMVPSS